MTTEQSSIRVTFKDEGEEDGMVIGRIVIMDEAKMATDPLIKRQTSQSGATVESWPFGHSPTGLVEQWGTLREAREIAATYGVELEEV